VKTCIEGSRLDNEWKFFKEISSQDLLPQTGIEEKLVIGRRIRFGVMDLSYVVLVMRILKQSKSI